MNAVQNRLATCIEALRSSKVTERKKAVQELKELLDQNEIIEFLNKVSVNNGESSVSWDMLFRLSHKALLLEVDKHPDTDKGKTQSTRGNSRLFYSSLVTIVAKKANRDGLYQLD